MLLCHLFECVQFGKDHRKPRIGLNQFVPERKDACKIPSSMAIVAQTHLSQLERKKPHMIHLLHKAAKCCIRITIKVLFDQRFF